jgi:hypothetical protein
MKYLKMLGLTAIAALGLMAFLGAGTASATVLCETTPKTGEDCPKEWDVKQGTVLDFSLEKGTSLLWKGPFGEALGTCTESTIKGHLENTGSTTETVKIQTTELLFAKCTNPVTVVKLGTMTVHHIAGTDNGTVTDTGTTIIIHTPLFGECKYETKETDIGTLTGRSKVGGDPTIDVAAPLLSENGCPNANLNGSFVYTGETTFDVAAG